MSHPGEDGPEACMAPGSDEPVALWVNGRQVEFTYPVGTTLAEALRDGLRLTGTRLACWESVCGACTVVADGLPVSSCSMLVHEAVDRRVWTVEGHTRIIDTVVEAFERERAYQCGFCTAGFVMAVSAALMDDLELDEERLLSVLDGNVCRCGAYSRIRTAALVAAAALRRGADE
jgi:aerobic-type carbon monoxide dehydrogenase small subunit (CoxS/CutS family)